MRGHALSSFASAVLRGLQDPTTWHQAPNTLAPNTLAPSAKHPAHLKFISGHVGAVDGPRGSQSDIYAKRFLRICVTWGRPRGALGAMLGCPLGPGGAQEVSRGAPRELDVKRVWVSPRFIDRSDAPGATASVSATGRRAGQPRFHNCFVSDYKWFVSGF